MWWSSRRAVCGSARKSGKCHKELQEAIKCMNEKRSSLLATMERKQKLMSGAPEESRRKVLEDVVVEDRISAVETELHATSEEMSGQTEDERRGVEGFGHCPSQFGWKGGVRSRKL